MLVSSTHTVICAICLEERDRQSTAVVISEAVSERHETYEHMLSRSLQASWHWRREKIVLQGKCCPCRKTARVYMAQCIDNPPINHITLRFTHGYGQCSCHSLSLRRQDTSPSYWIATEPPSVKLSRRHCYNSLKPQVPQCLLWAPHTGSSQAFVLYSALIKSPYWYCQTLHLASIIPVILNDIWCTSHVNLNIF